MARLCEGRVAIVTGGARGVGREHCLMLAEHGAKVVVNDLGGDRAGKGNDVGPAQQVVNEIKAMGGEAVANGDDVSDWNGAKRMIDQAVSAFGKLDAVVLNAGILRDRMLVNMTEDEWDAVIKVHLKGTFAPARHAAAYWRDQAKAKGGPVDARIITTTSVSGIYGNIGQTNYGAAKAGIASFTVIAARELGRYGVTVNSISPSAFTRMTEDLRDYTEEDKQTRSPKWIAPVSTWLVSEESREITGRVFQAGNGQFAVAEGWHKGPEIEADPRSAPGRQDPDRARQEGAQERRHERAGSGLASEGLTEEGRHFTPRRTVGRLVVLEVMTLVGQWPAPQRHGIEGVVGAGIDDQSQRRALAAAPCHHRLAGRGRCPVVERADQNQGRDRYSALLGPAAGVVGDGGAEMVLEQRLLALQRHGRQGHHRALRIADDGDAFRIDEELGREIEQAAVGIHHPIDVQAQHSVMTALGDAAWFEAVDEQQGVAFPREQGVAFPREAGGRRVLVCFRSATGTAMQRHDGREGPRPGGR